MKNRVCAFAPSGAQLRYGCIHMKGFVPLRVTCCACLFLGLQVGPLGKDSIPVVEEVAFARFIYKFGRIVGQQVGPPFLEPVGGGEASRFSFASLSAEEHLDIEKKTQIIPSVYMVRLRRFFS